MAKGTKAFVPPPITDYTWDTWSENCLAQAPATTDRDVSTDVGQPIFPPFINEEYIVGDDTDE